MPCVSAARKAGSSMAPALPANLMPTMGIWALVLSPTWGGSHAALGFCHVFPSRVSNTGGRRLLFPESGCSGAAGARWPLPQPLPQPLPVQPPVISHFSTARFCSAAPRSGWVVLAPGPGSQGCQLNCTTASLLPVMV